MPKLTMLSAPSASGKSTIARQMLEKDPNAVRLNRDDLRVMSILKWTPKREGWIIDAEVALANAAATSLRNIIVDDTNLMPKDEARWKMIAAQLGYAFQKIQLKVPMMLCLDRDSKRIAGSRIGRPAIERQFLRAGLWDIDPTQDVWIFDIDGTLADLTHRVGWIRVGGDCPDCKGAGVLSEPVYNFGEPCMKCDHGKITKKNHDEFYARVLADGPIEIVIKWIQTVYNEVDETGKRKNLVLIVSGRSPENCGDDTITWLAKNNVPYDHIVMRRPFMHGPDTDEKQLILNDILKVIPKERIAFVVDDRPSVVAMWKQNGLRVIPVRGRDDDEFYSEPAVVLTPTETTILNNQARRMTSQWKSEKKNFQRPLRSYIDQGLKRAQRWWKR